VPQDAYKIVAAMDEVIRQLPMEEPQHPGWHKLGLGYKKESRLPYGDSSSTSLLFHIGFTIKK
jgi:hypothetical protein